MASLIRRGNRYYVRIYIDWKRKEIAARTGNARLLERAPGTGWPISHHFWNDLPTE